MTGPAASIVAQAKLNLHLSVLAREPSGFHSLETIFHRVDLGDEISVCATSGERTIDVDGADVGPAESNLAFRAAVAYSHRAGWPRGFRIELNKRVPVGAGMGGGSADAAAVLRVLDSLAPDSMGSHALMDIGGSLGADVPFLAGDAVMALAWGRGEKLSALPPLPRRAVLLMTPDFSVPSADAYAWLDQDRSEAGNPTPAPGHAADSLASSPPLTTWERLASWAWNDFEPVIVARHPELGEMLAKLRRSRPVFSGMTGSGSTLFGILDGPLDFAKLPVQHGARVRSTMSATDVVQPLRIE